MKLRYLICECGEEVYEDDKNSQTLPTDVTCINCGKSQDISKLRYNQPTTFKAYLEEICFKDNTGVLDDNMHDFFIDWLSELDVEYVINTAQKWHDDIIK